MGREMKVESSSLCFVGNEFNLNPLGGVNSNLLNYVNVLFRHEIKTL